MSNDNSNNEIKLVNFKTKQQQQIEELDTNIKEAVQECFNRVDIENTNALFTISFDKEGNPNVFFAGNIDPLKMIGTLEYAKALFLDFTPVMGDLEYGDLDDTH